MNLILIENRPKHIHTISKDETAFLITVNHRDYYYRESIIDHCIDVRYSSEPSNYVTWTVQSIPTLYKKDSKFENLVPKFIYNKVLKIIKQKEERFK